MSNGCAALKSISCSTAALAGAALSAHSAGAGPNHFVAAAMRTDDVHKHVPERFLHAVSMTAAIAQNLRPAVVRRVTRDHVDQFSFAGPRQVGHRTIERFLFHLPDFF